jgi:PPOX class probable F420-dependent enzyme
MTDDARSLLEDKNFAHVTTLDEDGEPHTVLVWVHPDDDGGVALNSAKGRKWVRNVERDPRVWILVADQENPYRYTRIEGRVTENTTEGADEHIDFLAKKYMDEDSYPFRTPDEQRVKLHVEPETVKVHGG